MVVHLTNPVCYNIMNHILPTPPLGVIPWWHETEWADSDGEGSPSVLFAYGADAASYAASKINLKNPGTYDLTPFDAEPDWTAPAWTFNYAFGAGSQLFMTGYTRPDLDFHWTVAVKAALPLKAYTAFVNAGNNDICIRAYQYLGHPPPDNINSYHFSANPGIYNQTLDASFHVFILAGWKMFFDGVLKQTIIGGTYPYSSDAGQSNVLQLGGEVYGSQPVGATNQIARAIGISREISDTEAAALTVAMNS